MLENMNQFKITGMNHQGKLWKHFAASCRVLHPPLRGIVQPTNSVALRFRNWGFTIKYITGRRKQAGATLLIIIIGMIVVAVLGIALYTLTSTATLNQVIAQKASRAFYLSESGIRIAASEYKAAAPANKNAKMIALHNKTFTMPDTGSTIQINVYPYWLYANAPYGSAQTSITLYLPGGAPPIDDTSTAPITFPANGLLKIKDQGRIPVWQGVNYAVYSSAIISPAFDAANGTMVTFNFTLPTPPYPPAPNQIIAGDEFYVGYSYTVTQVPPTWGGDLILNVDPTDNNDDAAKIFPVQRGTIFVVTSTALSQYSYDSRILTTTFAPHTVRLTNIQALVAGAQPPANIPSPAQIYVGKSLGFRSTSTYGQ
jgi:hypothetical protein